MLNLAGVLQRSHLVDSGFGMYSCQPRTLVVVAAESQSYNFQMLVA
jgi:hypothetical protein